MLGGMAMRLMLQLETVEVLSSDDLAWSLGGHLGSFGSGRVVGDERVEHYLVARLKRLNREARRRGLRIPNEHLMPKEYL